MANFNITINEVVKEILGQAVSKGDIIYLSGNSKWYLADANTVQKSTTELRIALQAGVADQQIDTLAYGYYEYTDGTVLIPGTILRLSSTPGKATTQVYASSNRTVRIVGTAFDSTTILFNPDQSYITENGRKVNGVDILNSHVHVEADIIDLDKYTKSEVDALIISNNPSTFEQGRHEGTNYNNHDFEKVYLGPNWNDTSFGGIHGFKYVGYSINALFGAKRNITGDTRIIRFNNLDDLTDYDEVIISDPDYRGVEQIAFSEITGKLYVSLSDYTYGALTEIVVHEIDPVALTTNEIIRYNTGGAYVGATNIIEFNGYLYVADSTYGGNIFKFDINTHQYLSTISPGFTLSVIHNLFTDGEYLFVSSYYDYGDGLGIARILKNDTIDELVRLTGLVSETPNYAGLTDDAIVLGDYIYIPTEELVENGIYRFNKKNLADNVLLKIALPSPNTDIWGIDYDGSRLWYVGDNGLIGSFDPNTKISTLYKTIFGTDSANEVIRYQDRLFYAGFDAYPVTTGNSFVARSAKPFIAIYQQEIAEDGTWLSDTDYATGFKTINDFVGFEDGNGELQGTIGTIEADDIYPGSPEGLFITATRDTVYDENDGGVLLGIGITEIRGTIAKISTLEGTGNRQVFANEDGALFATEGSSPSWAVSDLSTGSVEPTIAPTWVVVPDLIVTFPQNVPSGQTLIASSNLAIRNGSVNQGGSVQVGFGINGVDPTSVTATIRIDGGFEGIIPFGLTISAHSGFTAGDTLQVFIRESAADSGQFDPQVDGTILNGHDLYLSAQQQGVGGGDVYLAGDNVFTGNNTFNNPVVGADPTLGTHFVTKQYLEGAGAPDLSGYVTLATEQEITAKKTFTAEQVFKSSGFPVQQTIRESASITGSLASTTGVGSAIYSNTRYTAHTGAPFAGAGGGFVFGIQDSTGTDTYNASDVIARIYARSDGAGGGVIQFFGTQSSPNMTIRDDGSVGIGAVNPSYKLEVIGDVRAQGNGFFGDGVPSLTGSLNVYRNTTADFVIDGGNVTRIARFQESAPNVLDIAAGAGGVMYLHNNIDNSGSIAFSTRATTMNERMRITNSGDVGIGIAVPTEKLDVVGNIKASGVGIGSDPTADNHWVTRGYLNTSLGGITANQVAYGSATNQIGGTAGFEFGTTANQLDVPGLLKLTGATTASLLFSNAGATETAKIEMISNGQIDISAETGQVRVLNSNGQSMIWGSTATTTYRDIVPNANGSRNIGQDALRFSQGFFTGTVAGADPTLDDEFVTLGYFNSNPGASIINTFVFTAVDYSTANNDADTDKTIVATANITYTLSGTGLTVGFRQQIFNNSGGAITLASTDTINGAGVPGTLADGYFAYCTLSAAGSWLVSVASASGGGGGSGDVTKVGTPVDNQIAVWTGDGTIEGTNNFTYDDSVSDAEIFSVKGDVIVPSKAVGVDAISDVVGHTIEVAPAADFGGASTSLELSAAGAFIKLASNVSGGWARTIGGIYKDGDLSHLGGIGAYGSGGNLNYLYMGAVYNDAGIKVSDTGEVAIGLAGTTQATSGKSLEVGGDAVFQNNVEIPLLPTLNEHAASKKYVDDKFINIGTWGGNWVEAGNAYYGVQPTVTSWVDLGTFDTSNTTNSRGTVRLEIYLGAAVGMDPKGEWVIEVEESDALIKTMNVLNPGGDLDITDIRIIQDTSITATRRWYIQAQFDGLQSNPLGIKLYSETTFDSTLTVLGGTTPVAVTPVQKIAITDPLNSYYYPSVGYLGAGGGGGGDVYLANNQTFTGINKFSATAAFGDNLASIDSAYAVHIKDTGAQLLKIERTTSANAVMSFANTVKTWYFGSSNANGDYVIGTALDLTSNRAFMIDASNSRVGIGVQSAPEQALEVVGNIKHDGVVYAARSDSFNTGTSVIVNYPVASYNGAFFDYVLKNGSNMRAGRITMTSDGTGAELVDASTADIGDTSGVSFSASTDGTNMTLSVTAGSDGWTIKSDVKLIVV